MMGGRICSKIVVHKRGGSAVGQGCASLCGECCMFAQFGVKVGVSSFRTPLCTILEHFLIVALEVTSPIPELTN